MLCTACVTNVPDDDLFCENCGARLPGVEPQPGACTCGAPALEIDEDGYCLVCGKRVRRPASDHIELTLSPEFAAVSDRGQRHDRNEDRFALAHGPSGFGLVVCDGVSATTNAETASAAAAEVIGNALTQALAASTVTNPADVLRVAIARAAEALRAAGSRDRENAPSTTAVAAIVTGGELTLAWVGDSRAYWLAAEGAVLLTQDHSWRNTVLASGQMTAEEADAAPQAHAITRWLGADADDAATPDLASFPVSSQGTLLLCSDGLWNYADSPEQIASLVTDAAKGDALEQARKLVSFANEQGGRDNITVALLHIGPPAQEAAVNLAADFGVQGE